MPQDEARVKQANGKRSQGGIRLCSKPSEPSSKTPQQDDPYRQHQSRNDIQEIRHPEIKTYQQVYKTKEGQQPFTKLLESSWRPHEESNLDLRFRKPVFYPLNYGGDLKSNARFSQALL